MTTTEIPNSDRPIFLTSVELAERWKVSRTTLWRLAQRGDSPPALRVGGSMRFRLSDIEAWEAANTVTGPLSEEDFAD
jgi:excisionase family DNA binding protein